MIIRRRQRRIVNTRLSAISHIAYIPSSRLLRNIDSYERLLRSLLDLPNKPAVMNIQ